MRGGRGGNLRELSGEGWDRDSDRERRVMLSKLSLSCGRISVAFDVS